jgi:prepilin-type N-terminal cleavage/methylation domain-containing protein
MKDHIFKKGFTLVELMVVVTIIALLSAVLFANFGDARMSSRDKARMTELKELQLSLELYKAQYGRYPAAGCSASASNFAGPGPATASNLTSCTIYITGHTAGVTFVPDFISQLPTDPMFENQANRGFYYRTDASGSSYKLMVFDAVELETVTAYGEEFARCPAAGGACPATVPANTYAVYSVGAEDW